MILLSVDYISRQRFMKIHSKRKATVKEDSHEDYSPNYHDPHKSIREAL